MVLRGDRFGITNIKAGYSHYIITISADTYAPITLTLEREATISTQLGIMGYALRYDKKAIVFLTLNILRDMNVVVEVIKRYLNSLL